MRAADEHVVEHQAERVDVGALIDLLPARLLRRHVLNRAHDRAVTRCFRELLGFGRPAGSPCRPDRDFGTSGDRAMPKSMISASPFASTMMFAGFRSRWTTPALCAATRPATTSRAIRMTSGTARRPSRLRSVARSSPSTKHRDVLDALDLAEIVNADDVLVGHLTGQEQLPFEPALDFRRRRGIRHDLRTNDFDRDGDAELGIPRLVDRAHAADAEHADDVVARAETFARLEHAACTGAWWGSRGRRFGRRGARELIRHLHGCRGRRTRRVCRFRKPRRVRRLNQCRLLAGFYGRCDKTGRAIVWFVVGVSLRDHGRSAFVEPGGTHGASTRSCGQRVAAMWACHRWLRCYYAHSRFNSLYAAPIGRADTQATTRSRQLSLANGRVSARKHLIRKIMRVVRAAHKGKVFVVGAVLKASGNSAVPGRRCQALRSEARDRCRE